MAHPSSLSPSLRVRACVVQVSLVEMSSWTTGSGKNEKRFASLTVKAKAWDQTLGGFQVRVKVCMRFGGRAVCVPCVAVRRCLLACSPATVFPPVPSPSLLPATMPMTTQQFDLRVAELLADRFNEKWAKGKGKGQDVRAHHKAMAKIRAQVSLLFGLSLSLSLSLPMPAPLSCWCLSLSPDSCPSLCACPPLSCLVFPAACPSLLCLSPSCRWYRPVCLPAPRF